LVVPDVPQPNRYMMQMGMTGRGFNILSDQLRAERTLKRLDLKNGIVPEDVDVLALAAPDKLDEKQVFAVDQFLMKGGTVILASSAFGVQRTRDSLRASKHTSGLEGWLKHHGISFGQKLVLDVQNEKYPVPKRRQLGAFTVEEIELVTYPPFVDIRSSGMSSENTITAGIPQVTLNWPSPIKINEKKNEKREVEVLLESSPKSWATSQTTVEPNFTAHPEWGFPIEGDQKSFTLAALVEGSFESFYKGKESPLLKEKEKEKEPPVPGEPEKKEEEKEKPVITGMIEKSPDSSRIIVFGSNDFLADATLQISAGGGSQRFVNSLNLIGNAVDWSLEDRALLTIKSRGHFSRTLKPMQVEEMRFWMYLNCGLVLLGLLVVFLIQRLYRSRLQNHYRQMLHS